MSMAIKRASYTGDPGFFDFLKKAAGVATSFIPVVGGGISEAIMGMGRQPPRPTAGPGAVWLGTPGFAPRNGGTAMQIPKPGIPAMFQRAFEGGATGMMPANGSPISAGGYHLNKSDYFLKTGEYVPAGTKWVKNRKRNPANARATSRAISRVVGAKRYATTLSRISIRKKC